MDKDIQNKRTNMTITQYHTPIVKRLMTTYLEVKNSRGLLTRINRPLIVVIIIPSKTSTRQDKDGLSVLISQRTSW